MDADKLRAIAFELEYWKSTGNELDRINAGIGAAADSLMEATVATLTLMTCPEDRRLELTGDVMEHVTSTLGALRGMQTPIASILELVEGRLRVLDAAVDGARGDDNDTHSRGV